jgi:hypothetical protein
MEEIELNTPLRDYCSLCGFMIDNFEKCAAMQGSFVDFDRKVTGEMNIVFCRECWGNILEVESGGMPRAIAKRRACESNDREDRQDGREDK